MNRADIARIKAAVKAAAVLRENPDDNEYSAALREEAKNPNPVIPVRLPDGATVYARGPEDARRIVNEHVQADRREKFLADHAHQIASNPVMQARYERLLAATRP